MDRQAQGLRAMRPPMEPRSEPHQEAGLGVVEGTWMPARPWRGRRSIVA